MPAMIANEGIADNNDDCVLLDALLLFQVRAVGDHSAHAEGQGEEHLACRSLGDLRGSLP